MGTRSITRFLDKDGKVFCAMYRQYDGYPDGHGQELARYLSGKKIVNGISVRDSKFNAFNGMGCLAAAVIAYFKNDIGEFYIVPPDAHDEEFVYTVRCDNSTPCKWGGTPTGGILMSVKGGNYDWEGIPSHFEGGYYEPPYDDDDELDWDDEEEESSEEKESPQENDGWKNW